MAELFRLVNDSNLPRYIIYPSNYRWLIIVNLSIYTHSDIVNYSNIPQDHFHVGSDASFSQRNAMMPGGGNGVGSSDLWGKAHAEVLEVTLLAMQNGQL